MRMMAALVALLGVSLGASAQTGGFDGPDDLPQVTVADIEGLEDDARAKLVGYVTRSVGDEKYEFRDDTGTITVEIDDDEWNGLEVSPDNRVEIVVEVDDEWRSTELDVEAIRKAD